MTQAASSPEHSDIEGPTWTKQIRQDGEFVRRATSFRNSISRDPTTQFAAESGRYHLYVSHACPWAHRTMIVRRLKGLEQVVSYDVSDWFLPHGGWTFTAQDAEASLDSVNGKKSLKEIYQIASPDYQGSLTVPTLWDKKLSTIANNESAEIIRMFNSEFNHLATQPEVDLYPEPLRGQIDEVNQWIYDDLNNGVYRAGFARTQDAYDKAVVGVFSALDRVEELLAQRRYLLGARFTEADVRLWTTLIRFDAVYNTHFKCSLRRLADYPHTWAYTRELYAHPAFHETTHFEHIRRHYFESHESVNPHRIVTIAPDVDYTAPHHREALAMEWFPSV